MKSITFLILRYLFSIRRIRESNSFDHVQNCFTKSAKKNERACKNERAQTTCRKSELNRLQMWSHGGTGKCHCLTLSFLHTLSPPLTYQWSYQLKRRRPLLSSRRYEGAPIPLKRVIIKDPPPLLLPPRPIRTYALRTFCHVFSHIFFSSVVRLFLGLIHGLGLVLW